MQFYIIFNDGGSSLVDAKDKYEAVEKVKKQCGNTTGIKEVWDYYEYKNQIGRK